MPMKQLVLRSLGIGALAASAALWTAAAPAEIVLSDLVVELQPGNQARADVEIWNSGPERAYVVAEPAEVIAPGTTNEARRRDADPEKLGLLVTPARMILEPGQRRLLRIAALGEPSQQERTFRVTTRPVAGQLQSEEPGIKLLVGYDILVLSRPADPRPNLESSREPGQLTIRNIGNVSVELVDGQQCNPSGDHCEDLPGKRLYAGSDWTVPIRNGLPVHYLVHSPAGTVRQPF